MILELITLSDVSPELEETLKLCNEKDTLESEIFTAERIHSWLLRVKTDFSPELICIKLNGVICGFCSVVYQSSVKLLIVNRFVYNSRHYTDKVVEHLLDIAKVKSPEAEVLFVTTIDSQLTICDNLKLWMPNFCFYPPDPDNHFIAENIRQNLLSDEMVLLITNRRSQHNGHTVINSFINGLCEWIKPFVGIARTIVFRNNLNGAANLHMYIPGIVDYQGLTEHYRKNSDELNEFFSKVKDFAKDQTVTVILPKKELGDVYPHVLAAKKPFAEFDVELTELRETLDYVESFSSFEVTSYLSSRLRRPLEYLMEACKQQASDLLKRSRYSEALSHLHTFKDFNHDEESIENSSTCKEQSGRVTQQPAWFEKFYRPGAPQWEITWCEAEFRIPESESKEGTGVLQITRTKYRNVHPEGQVAVLRLPNSGDIFDWTDGNNGSLGTGESAATTDPIDGVGTSVQSPHQPGDNSAD